MLRELGASRSGEWLTVTLALVLVSFPLAFGHDDLQRDITALSLANDQSLPRFGALSDNVGGVSLRLSVNGAN